MRRREFLGAVAGAAALPFAARAQQAALRRIGKYQPCINRKTAAAIGRSRSQMGVTAAAS